jgi:hypothetical protein
LVRQDIESISFKSDSVIPVTQAVLEAVQLAVPQV